MAQERARIASSSAVSGSPAEASGQGGVLFAALMWVLLWPAFVHASVVVSSALGQKPLSGRWPALMILLASTWVSTWLARAVSRSPMIVRGEVSQPALPGASAVSARVLLWLGCAAFCVACTLSVLLPTVGYDALAYRLPVIAQWLDAGSVAWVVTDDPVRNGYPLGQEAVSAVIAAVSGNLRFANATSFLYVAQGALAVAWLARASGVRASLASAVAGLFLLTPMTLLNAPSAYVDAAFAGATVAFLCMLSAYACDIGLAGPLAIATGLAASHVLALKGTGLPFVVITLGFVFALALLSIVKPSLRGTFGATRTHTPRARVLQLGLMLLCASPGAFWVARNVLHTGNPLWPVTLNVAGHTLFKGVASMEQVLDVAHNTPPRLLTMSEPGRVLTTWLQLRGPALDFDDRLAGLGYAWPLFAVPALLCFAWRMRSTQLRDPRLRAIALVLVLTLLCFLLQPMKWWPRYTLWLWGAGALALAAEAERWVTRGSGRAFQIAVTTLTVLTCGEGLFALSRAHGVQLVRARDATAQHPGGRFSGDIRFAPNAAHWVAPRFWALGLQDQAQVCRGAWKPGTDNPNLDGVFAQFSPRPQVHVVSDDNTSWARVRASSDAFGCRELLLFTGSPVLASARRDPGVSVEAAVAFDPLFIVRALPSPVSSSGSQSASEHDARSGVVTP